MIREAVLQDFSTWDSEKQLSEYQAYKSLGLYFTDEDFKLMEDIMNNHNAEIECENGVCHIVSESPDYGRGDKDFNNLQLGKTSVHVDKFSNVVKPIDYKKHKGKFYSIAENILDSNIIYLFVELDENWLMIGEAEFNDYKIKNKSGHIKQVDSINIHEDYRGKGLSTFLYRRLKSISRWSIVSGNMQYEGARKIWTSLAKKDGIKIYDEKLEKMSSDYFEIDNSKNREIWNGKNSRKVFVFETLDLSLPPLKANVLENFSAWDSEKQLSEYQSYKRLGSYSPFNEDDYKLMEMIINNPNAEVDVECENGVCRIDESSGISVADASKSIEDEGKSKKVIHLLDIIFDDTKDVLPDTEEILKAPTLLSALKTLIASLAKSSKSEPSVDIFFDKNVSNTKLKAVNDSLIGLVNANKLDKIKFSKDNKIGKFLAQQADENGVLTFKDAFSIPFIKMIVYLSSTGKSSLTKAEKSFIFDEEKLDFIKNTNGLDAKVNKFAKKIGTALKTIFDGAKDKYVNSRLEDIDASNLKDESKDLEKLKAIGAEEEEKEELGKKISKEIHSSTPSNKRKLILEKMGYDESKIKDILEKIKKTKELSDIEGKLLKSNVVSSINSRWSELLNIDKVLGESLYNKKFEGEGKGERLIEFLFPTMRVNGGSESFDIEGTNGSDNFEVKAYKINGKGVSEAIKLGVEGKATRSNLFNEIQIIISRLQDIFSKPKHYEVLKYMINGLDNEDILKDLITSITTKLTLPVPGTTRTFKEAMAAGEFSGGAIKEIGVLLVELHKLFSMIKDNNFFYLKVIGKMNEVYKIVGEPEKNGENTIFTAVETEATEEDEKELISSILDILGNKKLSTDTDGYFDNVIDELEGIINKDFKEHPMILMYDTGANNVDGNSTGISNFNEIVNGLYDDFKVLRITRGNVAILPTEHYNIKIKDK